jgi:hypothetical protein
MPSKPQPLGKEGFAPTIVQNTPNSRSRGGLTCPDTIGYFVGERPMQEYFAVFLAKTTPVSELAAAFGVPTKEVFVDHVLNQRALGGQVFWVKPKMGSPVKLQAFAASRYVTYQCKSDREFIAPLLNYPPVDTTQFLEKSWWPPKPEFKPPVCRQDAVTCRASLPNFGEFDWDEGKGDAVVIRGSWEKDNIVDVPVPQVQGIRLSWNDQRAGGSIRFHRKAALQLQRLWSAWEGCGLLRRIVDFSGGFNPRYQHNTHPPHTAISNHSFGTAFDINVNANPQGKQPARLGEVGCVRDMVEVASQFGFYWGGFFPEERVDGEHFEVARLL